MVTTNNKNTQLLELKYVLLDDLIPLEGNSKKHDTENTISSIITYGFRDPIEIDLAFDPPTIVAGHDRRNALLSLRDKAIIPSGIKLDSKGNWHIPCIFYKSETTAQGIAYSIDNNASTIKGAGLTLTDELKLFEPEELLAQIEWLKLEESDIVSFDASEVQTTLNSILSPDFEPEPDNDPTRLDQKKLVTCPNCQHEFSP